jgi:ferric-dicitrate binding protein FerR (iron transport regulator)
VFCSDECAKKTQQHAQRFNEMKRRDEEQAQRDSRRKWRARLMTLVVLLVVVGGLVLWLKTTDSAWPAARFPALVPWLKQLGLMK